jgi:hypothetical protein
MSETAKRYETKRREGFDAFFKRVPVDDNPYLYGTDADSSAWECGWHAAFDKDELYNRL